MSMKRGILLVAVLLSGVVLGLGAAWLLRGEGAEIIAAGEGAADDDGGEKKILYWAAPMDPSYRRDEPGKSPMGMDLIPVYEGEEPGSGEEPGIRISPAVTNNIGVRTAPVERGDLSRVIETVGYLDYDETRVTHVHLRSEGWIEDLRVRSVGEPVEKGDLLFEIYSPDLVNAQAELVQALRAGREGLIDASTERLRALDVPQSEIDRLRRTREVKRLVPIYAPQSGVVAELNVGEGMYVEPATEIMVIADLSAVWLLADVFEDQAAWVRAGLPAEMTLPYAPGRIWEGRVDYVYPTVDPKTRTVKVRFRFDNPTGELRPDMFAEVDLFTRPKEDVLSVPREAVIRTGDAERVILAMGNGRFQPAAVVTGVEAGDRIEILKGLAAGEKVVTSGQFLIDSEASVSASLRRLDAEPGAEPAEEEPAAAAIGEGIVDAITPAADKITLSHDPIPTIGWPAMTMDFALLDGVDLDGIEPGDKVRFTLAQMPDGMWAVQDIEAAEAGRGAS